ncbi:hypothetical protein AVEN_123914-1, partial [Araneus ventricosus]
MNTAKEPHNENTC